MFGMSPSIARVARRTLRAKFAKISQDNGIVPIVEPELLVLEGNHDINKSKEVTIPHPFGNPHLLKQFGVQLNGMLF